jgi:Mg-chelatase subunit ChlD
VQFDGQDPYEVIYDAADIKGVKRLTKKTYVPRGMTPLLDALGQGINEADHWIGRLAKTKRPERVIFVVVTDGMENASKEFKKSQVTKMIKQHQKEKEYSNDSSFP